MDTNYEELLYEPPDKMLVFGGTGGLGKKLSPLLAGKYEVHCLGRESVNTYQTELDKLDEFFNRQQPDIVVNMGIVNIDATLHKLPATRTDLLDCNIFSATNILSCALRYFRSSKKPGTFIYVSSLLSKRPVFGAGLYSATKAYNDSLIKTAALESAALGITCNSIQLGYFDGGLTYKLPEEFRQSLTKKIPVQRLGTVEDLARTIDYLHQTRYITGTAIELSGGCSI
jgi:NAD(P)-dependent dehydrogenase (short-subunit alcohol dehydrogenase family)